MSYPSSFDQIVGQRNAKEALRVEISRARRRNEPLPHLLLTGGPGLGKSDARARHRGRDGRHLPQGRARPAQTQPTSSASIFHESAT